ncbi:MFS transporter [Nocardia sp. CDC153]|nr:MFS transporter [Nocardia sp. CDC153]MEC3954019.1 MFS transporter [Nocardia sp. CDC153]
METTAMPPAAAPERDDRAGRREWIGLGVLTLACLVYAMDLTVLDLAVPKISAALHPSSSELLWIIDIYGFVLAGLLLTMGTLGDHIGRRRLLLLGAAVFGTVSIVSAFSPNAECLIACRALLGIAGATIAPSTLSLIFTMFRDPRQRALAVGTWVSAFSAGGIVGPLLGGVLLERFWWGSVFFLAVPVMALLLIVGPRVLPEFRDPEAGRLDLTGAALSVITMVSLVLAMKKIAQDGIGTLPVAAALLGLVAGALFVRRQLTHPDPLLDLRLFAVGRFRTALAINVIAVFVLFGYLLFIAQYFQLILGLTPIQTGMAMVPTSIASVIGAQAAPYLVRVLRPAYLIGAGMALAASGLLLLTRLSADDGPALAVLASFIISLGLAPVFGITTELIVGSVPPERSGAASGLSETGSELGGALGISILGTIGLAIYRGDLARSLPHGLPGTNTVRDTLGGAVQVAGTLPGELSSTILTAARAAFLHGIHVTAWVAAIGAIAIGVLALARLR